MADLEAIAAILPELTSLFPSTRNNP